MINPQDVLRLHKETVAKWHAEEIANPYQRELELVCQQHSFNFRLWHQEDIARSPNVSDARIADVKRKIDRLNQQRNDHIEKLDDWITGWIIAEGIKAQPDAPMNSETPGSIIDRMSIMSLRIYHMHEQTQRDDVDDSHLDSVRQKLDTCHEQLDDLANCLGRLLEDIRLGRKQHKTYRQFKMYNDPSLNPYLYAKVPG